MHIREEQAEKVRLAVLKKLYRREAWENTYVPVETALGTLPGHLKGLGKQVILELVKEGFLIFHKNNSCVSLNSRRMAEIINCIKSIQL